MIHANESVLARTGVLLVLGIVVMGLVRLCSYGAILEMDQATYAVIAREMLSGRELYSDLWDHKPPLVFMVYGAAQVVAGVGAAHIYLLGLLAATATMLGVYRAAAFGPGARATGLAAAAFFTVVAATPRIGADQPNSESFINVALVWAFALLLGAGRRGVEWGRFAGIGALFAAASHFKHVSVAVAAALVLVHLAYSPRGRRVRAVVEASLIVATGALSWALMFGYFALVGRFADAWDANITFNMGYAGSTPLVTRFDPRLLFPAKLGSLHVLVLACCAGMLMLRPPLSRRTALLAAYAVSCGVAIALPGRFHYHYYQLWLPVLCIGAAWAMACSKRFRGPSLRHLALATLTVLAAAQVFLLRQEPDTWLRFKDDGARLAYNYRLAGTIDALLPPNATFYQWGHYVELYYYTGRRPPAGELRSGHLFSGGRVRERALRLVGALDRERPELVLTAPSWPFERARHPVVDWLRENYVQFDPSLLVARWHSPFGFYCLRGGDLDARIQEARRSVVR